MASCLKELPEESIALKAASSGIVENLFKVQEDNKKSDSDKAIALEILDKISSFPKTHETLLQKNLLEFLANKFDQFLSKQASQLKSHDLKELNRAFDLTTNLAKNNAISAELNKMHILDKLVEVYNSDKEVSFLSDLYIKSLYDISSTYQGVLTLKTLRINLKELAMNAITSKNKNLVEYTEKIIYNLIQQDELKQAIGSIKSNDASFDNLALLAFTSANEMISDLLEDQDLMRVALGLLNDSSQIDNNKFCIIKYFSSLVKLEEKHVRYLENNGVPQTILGLLGKSGDFIFLTEVMELLANMAISGGENTSKLLNSSGIIQAILNLTADLSKILEDFSKKALTTTKALDSIEYHKSETTRIILETIKNVKPNELVPMKVALDYISCEHYAISILIALAAYTDKNKASKLMIPEGFISTCNALMKVFKNSKKVNQQIFETLSRCGFSTEVGNHIISLNWPFLISDTIWKKLNWKYFALYVLRFLEVLMANETVLRNLKKGVNTIKLVASIKHFINEEDYKDFDENFGNEDEEENKDPPDQLKFSEEREIHKKGIVLLEKLIDTASLQTFKNNIDANIKTFRPKPEIIQILRAEYAVLTSVNGINYFGNEGLKGGLHQALQKNIDEIERIVNKKDFQDKEKLMADCVRAIANFVCITWNETGKNMYEKHEVSVIVFKLFERYLKESKSPLASYIMLKAFKEWLINRIEIIENASNFEREKIYDPESFMMVPLQKKEQTIVDVLDSLYLTYQKFSTNEKVVNLNFEVIILLGYVYPQWKTRVAKNFIPQILSALQADHLGKESDFKSIDLLKQLTGTDDKADEIDKEALESAANANALEIICKSISDNDYDQNYINHCRPILEALGNDMLQNKNNAGTIENMIEKIQQFNRLSDEDKKKPENLKNVLKANENLNALCLVDTLRKLAFEKGHPSAIGSVWGTVNDIPRDNLSKEQEELLDKIEKSCMITVNQHLREAENNSEGQKKLFGDPKRIKIEPSSPNILINAMKSLQKNKANPHAVLMNSKILNACFPSSHANGLKQLASDLKLQNDLDYIFKSYGSGDDKDLAQEATNLYVNLSENKDDDMIDKIIKKDLRKLKQDLNNENSNEIEDSLNSLIPFVSHPVFCQRFDEYDILDYILKTLKHLHKKCGDKLNKTPQDLLKDALGGVNVPDLGPNNRKLIADEMKLTKSLCNLITGLPEALKEKVRNHNEIVKLSDAAFVLNSNFNSYDIIEDYAKNPVAKDILHKNKALEAATFILMKANKDSFKLVELPDSEDLGRSTMMNLKKSNLGGLGASAINLAKSQIGKSNIMGSQIPGSEDQKSNAGEQNKEEVLNQNFDKYANLLEKLMTPQAERDIIEEYIKALNEFVPRNEQAQANLFEKSRMMMCLMQSKKDTIDLSPYAERLKKAFGNFLDASSSESAPNKKLFRFFDNILFKVAKNLDGKPQELRSKDLWNKVLDRYFVTSPALSKSNPKKVLKNLALLKPKADAKPVFKDFFEERTGKFGLNTDFGNNNLFTEKNLNNIDKILANFNRVLVDIPDALILDNLEAFSRSKSACKALISNPLLEQLGQMITFYDDFENDKKFNDLANTLINCMAVASQDDKAKAQITSKIHANNLMNVFVDNIENNREKLLPKSFEALKFLYSVVPNKSIFFEKKLPVLLMNFAGSPANWDESKQQALLLLGKTLEDPSLEQQVHQEGLFEIIFPELSEQVITSQPKIPNPAEVFKKISELSNEPKTQKAELATYMLGELSKYPHYADQLAQEGEKTHVFEMYDAFEKLDNDPVIATKLIEATRNGVYALTDETLENYPDEIDSIVARIPAKIEKFSDFELVPKYLKDILDFFKKHKKERTEKTPVSEPTMLSRMTQTLSRSTIVQSQIPEKKEEAQQLKDTKDLSQIYKHIADQLAKGSLNPDDAKLYEIANEEVKGILENPNSQSAFSLMNLDIPKHLRVIANSPNSSNLQKTDALKLLNGFAANPDILDKMLEDDFYVQKSAELNDHFARLHPKVADLSKQERDPLFEDLKFLKALTDKENGAQMALNSDGKNLPLIQDLLDIVKSDRDDPNLKLKALEVLMNLLKAQNNPALEAKLMDEMGELFKKNMDVYPILCALTKLLGILAQNSDDNKSRIVKDKDLDFVKAALNRYPAGNLLHNNAAFAVFELSNAFPDSHNYILESGVLTPLAKSFNNLSSDKELHENMGKALLQIGYGSPEKKAKLIKHGFIMGLVPMLIKYSSPEYYDPDMCTIVLKCMANFSTIPQGIEHLLFDGVIPAFRGFFDKYKDELPLQNKLMMATVSNLAYDPKAKNLEKIIQDKGLDLIVDALKFYHDKKDVETTEVSIDALTHISVDPKVVDYLTKTDVTDILTDMLRQQMNDNLVYKSLRCLTKFADHDLLAKRMMDKGTHAAAADLFKPYKDDLKNVFQALKLLTALTDKYGDRIEDFVFSGIPEKIVNSFNEDWP